MGTFSLYAKKSTSTQLAVINKDHVITQKTFQKFLDDRHDEHNFRKGRYYVYDSRSEFLHANLDSMILNKLCTCYVNNDFELCAKKCAKVAGLTVPHLLGSLLLPLGSMERMIDGINYQLAKSRFSNGTDDQLAQELKKLYPVKMMDNLDQFFQTATIRIPPLVKFNQ